MSAEKWTGFTDEDIKRISKSTLNDCGSCIDRICEVDETISKRRGPMKIKKMPIKSHLNEHIDDDNVVQNDGRINGLISKCQDDNMKISEDEMNCICNSYVCCDNKGESATVHDLSAYEDMDEQKCKDLDESNAHMLPLELFEMRQKRIETENARRRALINKAINDKKMRTQAEAVKLAKITKELNQIDSSLSADVSILRDYIEKASFEFSEAEKRYLRAEKEFVEAKLILFEKMQKKEMLTEHLCAIIEQNENRKADKLVELMKQLEMEVLLDECELNGIQPILPNLCALNDEPYQTCQTIKPTSSKGSCLQSVNSSSEKAEKTEQDKISSEKSEENVCGKIDENLDGECSNEVKLNNFSAAESPVVEVAEKENMNL